MNAPDAAAHRAAAIAMIPIPEIAADQFVPLAENVLIVGDAWDELTHDARAAILMLTGNAWIGASCPWKEIPAQTRIRVAHGVYFFRDFLNRVLP